jgi:hypothetical protein
MIYFKQASQFFSLTPYFKLPKNETNFGHYRPKISVFSTLDEYSDEIIDGKSRTLEIKAQWNAD